MVLIMQLEIIHIMSDYIKAVTADNFTQEVIEKSQQVPVLVDFWAEWCAPCKQLMPVLHNMVDSLDGAVHLATVDTDTEQEIAMQYGIRSLPTVALFKDGEIVEQFMGVKPESEIRTLLEPYLAKDDSEAEAVAAASENVQKAMALIAQDQLMEAIPFLQSDGSTQAKLLLIKIYLQEGEIDKAVETYNSFEDWQASDKEVELIKVIIDLIQIVPKTDNDALKDAIEQTVADDPEQGIRQLLQLLSEAQDEEKEEIKQSVIIAFGLIGDPQLLTQLRRKMASIIFR